MLQQLATHKLHQNGTGSLHIPLSICKLIAKYCLRSIRLKQEDLIGGAPDLALDVSRHYWMLRDILSNAHGFAMSFRFQLSSRISYMNWKLHLVHSFNVYELDVYDSSLLYGLAVSLRMNELMNYSLSVCIQGEELLWDLFGDSDNERTIEMEVSVRFDRRKRRYCIQPLLDGLVCDTKHIRWCSGNNLIRAEWTKADPGALHFVVGNSRQRHDAVDADLELYDFMMRPLDHREIGVLFNKLPCIIC